jgi:hypothetical protein
LSEVRKQNDQYFFERLTDPLWFGLGQGGGSPDAISAVSVNGVLQRGTKKLLLFSLAVGKAVTEGTQDEHQRGRVQKLLVLHYMYDTA